MQQTTNASLNEYISYNVDSEDILLDMEILLREQYYGEFLRRENEMIIQFSNGENFVIKVEKAS